MGVMSPAACVATAILLLGVAYGNPFTTAGVNNGKIVVNAFGSVDAEPDQAVLRARVTAREASALAAREKVASTSKSIKEALNGMGILSTDITTSSFNLDLLFDYNSRGSMRMPKGYKCSESLTITVKDIEQSGEVVDKVALMGANVATIEGFSLTASDTTNHHVQARKMAVKNAKEKAEQLAEEAGAARGKLINIEEYHAGVDAPQAMMASSEDYMEESADASYSPTELNLNSALKVRVHVRAEFEIVHPEEPAGQAAHMAVSQEQGVPVSQEQGVPVSQEQGVPVSQEQGVPVSQEQRMPLTQMASAAQASVDAYDF